ncbi:cell division protein ZapB [Buchnera aphidicola]|uniref:cell division protein ZapB n=1 Tax=Buchnera aphidicola TaxID=9 RepID=UPI0002D5DA69|nr:cell division protein ZapB [Buchnera aphidicola]
MVLKAFSDLEKKVKESVNYIKLLKSEINDLKLKNRKLKNKLQTVSSLKENIEKKNIMIQEERIKWKNKLKSLLKKINNLN